MGGPHRGGPVIGNRGHGVVLVRGFKAEGNDRAERFRRSKIGKVCIIQHSMPPCPKPAGYLQRPKNAKSLPSFLSFPPSPLLRPPVSSHSLNQSLTPRPGRRAHK